MLVLPAFPSGYRQRRCHGLYQMAVVHSGQDTFADEISRSVRTAAAAVVGQGDLLDVLRDVPDSSPDSHVAVIYAASQDGARNATVRAQVGKALNLGFPVLPVTRASEEGSIRDSLPSLITHLNAVDWEHDRSLALATIMRILGLIENERRLFLSYVRRDSAKVAEQLHRALQERQFDVFLDRFSVPPGDDFHRRLTEDLADKAFSTAAGERGHSSVALGSVRDQLRPQSPDWRVGGNDAKCRGRPPCTRRRGV